MRELNIDRRPSRPTVKMNQAIVVRKKGKKVNAKVKTIGDYMIDVTFNGKTFTCTWDGCWIVQGN